MIESTTHLTAAFSSPQAQGFVVRKSDITFKTVHGEKVAGTLDPRREVIDGSASSILDYNATGLAGIGADRSVVFTISGEIDEPNTIQVLNRTSGVITDEDVPDFDYYNITIPAGGEDLVVWTDTLPTAVNGTTSMQTMLAIVSEDDLPNPLDLSTAADDFPRWRNVTTYTGSIVDEFFPGCTGLTITVEDISDDTGGPCVAGDNTSPSALGATQTAFDWANLIHNIMQPLFVMKPDPSDPDYDIDSYFEPRPTNTLTRDCSAVADETNDNHDDILDDKEFPNFSSFQEQILFYMVREDLDDDGATPSTHSLRNDNASEDLLITDRDSKDEAGGAGVESVHVDIGNNAGGYSVKNIENSILSTEVDPINTLTWLDTPNNLSPDCDAGVRGDIGFNLPPATVLNELRLTAGQTYTIAVASISGEGLYNLHLRKVNTTDRFRTSRLIVFGE